MQPPCGIVKLLVCPNPSPLPLPPGHWTTKLCLPSIFIPFTKNAQCSKGSVTSELGREEVVPAGYGDFPMARPWAGSGILIFFFNSSSIIGHTLIRERKLHKDNG